MCIHWNYITEAIPVNATKIHFGAKETKLSSEYGLYLELSTVYSFRKGAFFNLKELLFFLFLLKTCGYS